MSKPLARITITVPPDALRKADAQARRSGRSRSWVISEALRLFLAEPLSAPVVREPPSLPCTVGLGPQRTRQVEADLQLTPEQRVREAEEPARVADAVRPRPRFQQVVSFATLEDYFAWKKSEALRWL